MEALVIFDCMSKKVGPGLKDITFLRVLSARMHFGLALWAVDFLIR